MLYKLSVIYKNYDFKREKLAEPLVKELEKLKIREISINEDFVILEDSSSKFYLVTNKNCNINTIFFNSAIESYFTNVISLKTLKRFEIEDIYSIHKLFIFFKDRYIDEDIDKKYLYEMNSGELVYLKSLVNDYYCWHPIGNCNSIKLLHTCNCFYKQYRAPNGVERTEDFFAKIMMYKEVK